MPEHLDEACGVADSFLRNIRWSISSCSRSASRETLC